ncbi:MAG TPA: winged helix DNA-binding domain-containing protein [Solirubrobacteraceae bacterium]
MSEAAQRMTTTALNRALLARQGLLERLDLPLVDAVEAVGALQAQYWPAPPAALWSRVAGFEPSALYAALDDGALVAGTLLRATLHLVSAREHPAYAAVAAEAAGHHWRRTDDEPGAEVGQLLTKLRAYARRTPRDAEEIGAFVEQWLADHPKALSTAELERQRELKWRPFQRWSAFVRAPADGGWGAKAPSALLAAPRPRGAPTGDKALDEVVRRHLRAFGPAGPDDVAGWIGWRTPPVREAFERLGAKLEPFEDESGRALYDLPDAPRPDAETPAPPRLLAAFDSVLLAYAAKRRARILPDQHRDAVYERRNLQIRPSYLVDGLVAGTWSIEVKRREATLTLRPLERLARATRSALVDEAERLVRALHPQAKGHAVAVAR